MTVKVLHVFRTYFPDTHGGIEEVIRQICLNTSPTINSRIFTLSPNVKSVERETCSVSGVEVIRAPLWFEVLSCSFFYKGLGVFINECRWADIINYHFPWPVGDVLDLLVVRVLRKKRVVTYHSDIVRQKRLSIVYGPLMRSFLSDVDRVVATSPNYIASSKVLQKIPCEKMEVIPLGIDEASYPRPTDADADAVKKEFGERFVLFVGVLRYYKGLDILIEAMSGAGCNLVIAGHGPERKRLMEESISMSLKNVHFLGRVSDYKKMTLLRACTAFVLPSNERSEAFGVSLLEAAMLGKPLISAEIGTGTTFVNIDGETGIVVAPNSAEELRAAIGRLLDDVEMSECLGRRARERYLEFFTGEEMGRKYSELYQGLMFQ